MFVKQLKITALSTLTACGLLAFAGNASATPITCSVLNADANGANATACAGDNAIGANPSDETTFVNGAFAGDDFTFVDKTGEASSLAGFVLTVTADATPDPYKFLYTLTVPDSYVGTIVDWVLVVKQASSSTIAYLFDDVTLGIEGGYNSFWLNPSEKLVNDFSHASGLLRTTATRVPEPGTMGLLGAGLLAFGWMRRRKAA
jgi:hypothetical protein